jgi:Fe-S cluster assembly protein SufD
MDHPSAIARMKRAAAQRFAAAGLPHRRMEAWKYTDLRTGLNGLDAAPSRWSGALPAGPFDTVEADTLVFANGFFRADLSTMPRDPGIEIADLSTNEWPHWAISTNEYPSATALTDWAEAEMTGGVAIRVAQNHAALRPLLLRFLGQDGARQTRLILLMERGSSVTLVESHEGSGPGFENRSMTARLSADARLQHIKLGTGTHVSTVMVEGHAGSFYDAAAGLLGPGLTRHEVHLTHPQANGRAAGARLTAFALLDGDGHADVTTVFRHDAGDVQSDQVFKAVLGGAATGVYQGKVAVGEGADGTDSRQLAKAMLISPKATANLKPELEILADDVKCAHGATVGDLEDDALFYLRARGIPEAQARAMLIAAFLETALERLPESAPASAFKDAILARLAGLGAAQ